MFKVVTLYKFVSLDHLTILQKQLQTICKELIGTLLLASEGINGTIAGAPDQLEAAMNQIQSIAPLQGLFYQYSDTHINPFRSLKIKIKKQIITMANESLTPSSSKGQYVSAINWNTMLNQAAVVVDVRNSYEYRVGTFQGAINPKTTCFSAFPSFVDAHLTSYKHKPIALFCTGGIRCEKASAYMLSRGFHEIYQLRGGILQYLAHIPEQKTRWQGECFVFDRRIALGHGLKKGKCLLCYGCRMPLTADDLDESYQANVQCKYCIKCKT